MDPTKPAEIEKPEITEIEAFSYTATEPKVVRYENLNKRVVEWLIG